MDRLKCGARNLLEARPRQTTTHRHPHPLGTASRQVRTLRAEEDQRRRKPGRLADETQPNPRPHREVGNSVRLLLQGRPGGCGAVAAPGPERQEDIGQSRTGSQEQARPRVNLHKWSTAHAPQLCGPDRVGPEIPESQGCPRGTAQRSDPLGGRRPIRSRHGDRPTNPGGDGCGGQNQKAKVLSRKQRRL